MTAREPLLNRRLTLEARERVADGAGGFAETWVALGDHWAEVVAGSGREVLRDTLAVARVPWKITLRAVPVGRASRPRPDQRFREGFRAFRILAVAEADRAGRFLICHAIEEEVSA
ncbi:MAG: head-tail adaptor protein [Pseudomonadota bacterium]